MFTEFRCRFESLTLLYPRATLAVIALMVFSVIYAGDFNTSDTARRLQVTHWIWSDAPQVAANDSDLGYNLPGRNGKTYAPYGIGQSILMVPGDIVTHFVDDKVVAGHVTEAEEVKICGFLEGFLTFSLLAAASTVLSFELLILIGFPVAAALSATTLFVIGSSFLVYMQTAQENSLEYFCFVAALVFGLRSAADGSVTGLWIAGAFAGWSLLIKISNVVYLPALFMLLSWVRFSGQRLENPLPGRLRRVFQTSWSIAFHFGTPVVIGFMIDRLYEFYRFGDILHTYVAHEREPNAVNLPPGYPFGYPLLKGFLGPFVTPEKSIFLFDPILAFLIVALIFGHRRIAELPKLVLAGSLLVLLFFALGFGMTYKWGGDAAWGPRHHLVPVEMMCLVAFALAVNWFGELRPWLKALVVVNIVVAITCQTLALPKTFNIEVAQNGYGDPLRFVPLMRVRNLIHIAAGDFHDSGLDYGDVTLNRMATVGTENRIFVFRLGPYMSRTAQEVLMVLWATLLALTATAIGMIVMGGLSRQAGSETDDLRSLQYRRKN